jgi:hypothetical protein
MSISAVSLNLIAILLLISAILVFFSWRKNKTIFLRDFTVFLFSIASSSTCWAIAVWLIPINSTIAGYLHPLAGTFGAIGFLYFSHLVLTLTFPSETRKVLTLLIFLFLTTTPILWLYPPHPYISEEGITVWNIDFLPGFTLAINGIFIGGLVLGLFSWLGIRSVDKFTKIRSFLIASGLTVYLAGGLAHNLITKPKQYIFADLLTLLGVIILLLTIYLKKFVKE